ncbi:MAG: hypothetical protein Q7R43_01665 [Candidatus Daviesbacteria bacterium]|nr:hypothetical protein [Candidatus Daviesbacteria bacterium]
MWKILLLISLFTTLLVGLWFRDGYILGTAEDGLIFYNISNYYHQAEKTWMEYPGLGSPALSLVAAKPTLFILSYFQQIGVPGFLIQGTVIWFLLFSASVGIILLVKELFPHLAHRYILLASLFYWFNPISLVDVWTRFLLNYIFFFALLPIGSYLFVKGLVSQKYKWLFVLNLVLLLYSYAFSYIAFTILFWIWLFLITLFFILFNKIKTERLFFARYFLFSLIIFCLVNAWWVLTLIKLNLSGGSALTTDLFVSQNNTGLLDALSRSSGSLVGVMKLLNTSFLAKDSLTWVMFYYSPVLYIFQYVIFGSILYFIAKNKNNPLILILASLFFSVIFLAKGSNPPFGEIYTFIFSNVLILQVFRNPFEKFGFILSLISALLLAPAIFELNKWKNNLKKLIYPIFFVYVFFYLGSPFFSGLIFTNKFPPTNDYSIGYKVLVPQYYKEVNEWLISKGNNFRYIGFPIKDEGMTYKWEKDMQE